MFPSLPHPLQIRLASRYMESMRLLTAKSQYLKAVDFTFGILDRMKIAGYDFNGPTLPEIRARLVFLRKMLQATKGVSVVESIEEHVGRITNLGSRVVDQMLKYEQDVVPRLESWDAFLRPFPDNAEEARQRQHRALVSLVSRKMDIPFAEVESRIVSDRGFITEAFSICAPLFDNALSEVNGALKQAGLSPQRGRVKDLSSVLKKIGDKKVFTMIGDLAGTRVVSMSMQEMADACLMLQSRLSIAKKDNQYVTLKPYLAVHYDMLTKSGVVVEVQLKTRANHIEAAISHDLLHKPEKGLVTLTSSELGLVKRMLNVSVSVSLRELERAMASELS